MTAKTALAGPFLLASAQSTSRVPPPAGAASGGAFLFEPPFD
jgi:hypothetical protein